MSTGKSPSHGLAPVPGPMEVIAAKLWQMPPYLKQLGVYEAVLAELPTDTAQLLQHPLPITAWIPTQRVVDIYGALYRLNGPGSVRKMSFDLTFAAYAHVVGRLISNLLNLLGTTPQTLFGQSNSILGMFERGSRFSFTWEGANCALVTLRVAEPQPEFAWEIWEATPMVALRFLKLEATSERQQPLPGGFGASWRMSW